MSPAASALLPTVITTAPMLPDAVQAAVSLGAAGVEGMTTVQVPDEYVGVTIAALPVLAVNTRGVSLDGP